MTLDELNQLDFNDMGEWPLAVKLVMIAILCLALGAGAYYLDIQDQYKRLGKLEKKELSLRKEFERKQAKAANLDAYKAQLEEMNESFGAMLRQLPDRTEVADLLVDVSQTGLASGLEFKLFQPQAEVPKEFYAELPINIEVTGSYHEFGEFISGLSALPRIVTVHNIEIKPEGKEGSASLSLKAVAKTYRYLDGDEGE